MNICVFGGAFDPIHSGHINIAIQSINYFNIDKLIFMVSKEPPHKENHKAEFFHRYNMVKIALKSINNDKFLVSDIENKMKEKSYTYNSLIELKKHYKDSNFYFLTGSDIFSTITEWYNWEKLLDITNFIIGYRPGVSFESMMNNLPEKVQNKIKMKDNVFLFNFEDKIDISSSEIRSNVLLYKDFLDKNVYEYIINNKLYKEV